MAAGSIFAGIYKEPLDIKDPHSKVGIGISLIIALAIICMIKHPFNSLIYSQMMLSIQLPITIFLQIHLTNSREIMGRYANRLCTKLLLYIIGAIVTILNIALFISFLV